MLIIDQISIRPGNLELSAAEILRCKQEWEAFVQEAQLTKPRLLATVSGYGTHDYIHSAKVTYQWTSSKKMWGKLIRLNQRCRTTHRRIDGFATGQGLE